MKYEYYISVRSHYRDSQLGRTYRSVIHEFNELQVQFCLVYYGAPIFNEQEFSNKVELNNFDTVVIISIKGLAPGTQKAFKYDSTIY
jgi:hypothetical protein